MSKINIRKSYFNSKNKINKEKTNLDYIKLYKISFKKKYL